MDHAGDHLAILILHIDQDRRADRVQIPNVMSDVLVMADIFARIEINRHQRVRVEIVAGPDRAVEVWRRIAGDEEDALRLEVDSRILPHTATKRLIGIAQLLERRLLSRDVAMHVPARGILGRPHADGVLRRRVEVPHELARVGIIGAHETADTILATVGADQNLAVDSGRRHGFAVAKLWIGDLGFPNQTTGLGVESDELGIKRPHKDLVFIDGDAAIVGTAAIGRDGSHLVLVVPELFAGLGVEGIDVIERRGDVHHAVDDDRRRLQRLFHFSLENPCGTKLADIGLVDLFFRVEAGLLVIAVGMKKVFSVARRGAELILRHRWNRCVFDFCGCGGFLFRASPSQIGSSEAHY